MTSRKAQIKMTDINTKLRYIKNINSLSAPKDGRNPHIAKCGEFGIIRVHHDASQDQYNKRIFIVKNASRIANGGCWTFHGLRKAILEAE